MRVAPHKSRCGPSAHCTEGRILGPSVLPFGLWPVVLAPRCRTRGQTPFPPGEPPSWASGAPLAFSFGRVRTPVCPAEPLMAIPLAHSLWLSWKAHQCQVLVPEPALRAASAQARQRQGCAGPAQPRPAPGDKALCSQHVARSSLDGAEFLSGKPPLPGTRAGCLRFQIVGVLGDRPDLEQVCRGHGALRWVLS